MKSRMMGRMIYRAGVLVRGESAVYEYLPEAQRSLVSSREELDRRQATALASILALAASRSPYYAAAWSALDVGPDVSPSRSFQLLEQLPLIAKREIQQHGAEMIVPGHERANWKTTGGSTAEPVRILKSANGTAQEMAASWAHLMNVGVRIGDPSVRFWSMPLRPRAKVRGRLADLAMNRLRFSAFSFDDEHMSRVWAQCVRFRPRWIYGYSSMIDHFAKWIEETRRDGRELGLIAVVPTSEPLYDEMRERLQRVFGCSVMNEYGCGEVGPIAYSCHADQLHIVAENLVVEVLREDGTPAGPGESGEIVLTDLTNRAMPLVRYRMGDIAEVGEECTCGQHAPTLKRVNGRAYDVVHTPAGRRWNGWQVHYLLSTLQMELGEYRQYQVVQDGPDTLDVRLVADQPIRPDTEHRITSYIADQLDGMRARVRRVETVERAASGKLRVVRNDWRPGQQ